MILPYFFIVKKTFITLSIQKSLLLHMKTPIKTPIKTLQKNDYCNHKKNLPILWKDNRKSSLIKLQTRSIYGMNHFPEIDCVAKYQSFNPIWVGIYPEQSDYPFCVNFYIKFYRVFKIILMDIYNKFQDHDELRGHKIMIQMFNDPWRRFWVDLPNNNYIYVRDVDLSTKTAEQWEDEIWTWLADEWLYLNCVTWVKVRVWDYNLDEWLPLGHILSPPELGRDLNPWKWKW